MPLLSVPSIAELKALGADCPDSESKYARKYVWPCPVCKEPIDGRSQPPESAVDSARDKKRFVEREHAAFVEGLQQFIDKHIKEHANG